jgi:hypothetical protein
MGMDLRDFVRALRSRQTSVALEWMNEAQRAGLRLRHFERPSGLDAVDLAIAAGVLELLASRWHQTPPDWTREVPAIPEYFCLVDPRLRRCCEVEGPEPLQRRRLLAPPDFLTSA